MPKFHLSVRARTLVPALLFSVAFSITLNASAQATPQTATHKQLDRIDFAISGAGEITNTVSGVELRDMNTTHSTLTIKPSSTVGELVTLRYTAKPYVGFEFNFGNARYTQNYTFTPSPSSNLLTGGGQAGGRAAPSCVQQDRRQDEDARTLPQQEPPRGPPLSAGDDLGIVGSSEREQVE